MRVLSKPSSAQCHLNLYTLFLLAEPKYVSCQRLAQILEHLSHDSINRFLVRERYRPQDLFECVKPRIGLHGGTLSRDDPVLDEPYSNPSKPTLVDYFWSGKHKKVVKGINLITLYYTDPAGVSVPVNDRLNDKTDGKTKHDSFRERLFEVIAWGLLPESIQGTLIRKLCTYTQTNPTRRAIFEFDKLIRSIYTLRYLRDPQLQRKVHRSQNRIESYQQLRSAIAQVGGKKELTVRTDI